MLKQLSNSKTGGVVLIVLAIMLNGCGDVAAAAPTHFPPCPPTENAYTNPIEPNYISLYENSIVHSNDSALYDNDREAAFKELVNRVYDWSDTVDINTEGKNIRIAITYISPEIAQLIVINHYLYKRSLISQGDWMNK